MAKQIHRLSAISVKNLKPGRHSDGAGLYVHVTPDDRKYYVYRLNQHGRVSWKSLGPTSKLSLAVARQLTAKANDQLALGLDPFQPKIAPKTFAQASQEFVQLHAKSLRSEQDRRTWATSLGPAYCKNLQSLSVENITGGDVLKAVSPLWWDRNATAKRLLSRLAMVMDYCIEKGWREAPNPALKTNFKRSLPSIGRPTRHHPSMDYHDVPQLVADLKTKPGLGPLALRLLIATALRCYECLHMTWDEVDLTNRTVVIPAHRMKTNKSFTVVLNTMAMEVLEELAQHRIGPWVFAGRKDGKPLSRMPLCDLVVPLNTTIHGFRSSFRTFAGNETTVAFEICEQCLSHEVGNAVSRSYLRGTALLRRAELMEMWSQFCLGQSETKIIPFRAVG